MEDCSALCPDCGGELYIEDNDVFHGGQIGDYVIMCHDCSYMGEHSYTNYNDAHDELERLMEKQQDDLGEDDEEDFD